MSLNESHVEDAGLEWFTELGYAALHGPHLAPGEPAAGRDSFGEVVLVGRLREAIRRLNPAISEEARAAIKRYLIARFERRVNPSARIQKRQHRAASSSRLPDA